MYEPRCASGRAETDNPFRVARRARVRGSGILVNITGMCASTLRNKATPLKNPPSRNSLPLTHMKCILRKILMSLIASSPPAALSQAPKVGDIAPDFELMGSDGVVYKTSDFKDKKAIVVAWFPKAFTGG